MALKVVFDHRHQLNYRIYEIVGPNSIVIVKAEVIDKHGPDYLERQQWTKDYFSQLIRENQLSYSYKHGRK